MKPKILIDINSIIGKKTGVGVFTERLLINLAKTNNYTITAYYFNFLGKNKTMQNLPDVTNVNYKEIKHIPIKVLSVLHRLKFQIPIEFLIGFKKYNFVLFPNFVSLPSIKKTPQAVVIHDLAFLDCPQFVQPANQKYLRTFVKRSVKRASFVCTISEFTKSRIKYHYSPNKLTPVIVMPIPYFPFSTKNNNISMRIKNIVSSKYLLFVGTLEPRKNIDKLVLGFSRLPKNIKSKFQLVLAGKAGWDGQKLADAINFSQKEQSTVVTTGYVTNSEIELLYKNAGAVCLVTHYEGFGMPLLEASYFKKPIVVSSLPVFKEIAGNNAYYCNQNDVQDIARTLERVLKAKKPKLITNRYSWEENISSLEFYINKFML